MPTSSISTTATGFGDPGLTVTPSADAAAIDLRHGIIAAYTPTVPYSETLHTASSGRFTFHETADYGVVLDFSFAPGQRVRPTAIRAIEFREPTGRDVLLANRVKDKEERGELLITRLITRMVLCDGSEVEVTGDDRAAFLDAIYNAPAWQSNAVFSTATFLDFGHDDFADDEDPDQAEPTDEDTSTTDKQ